MKKLLQSLFVLMFVAVSAMAQDRTITGTVTGKDDGLPIPGVSIKVKGTTQGAATGADGKFSVKIPSNNAVLEISSLGYISESITVGSRNVVNITLSSDSKLLGEVVVTGLGVSRDKKALGYAVQTLKSEDLNKAGNASFVGALQGKLSGVEIKPSSGMPGASAQVVIRGARSFTDNNTPLYVIDGMPIASSSDFSTGNSVTGTDLANRSVDLDPNDIESMTVLKGQSASAIYGMRASNGVIVITTKSGKGLAKGRPVVSFNSTVSFEKISRKPEMQSTYAQGLNGVYGIPSSNSWGPKIEDLPNNPQFGGNAPAGPTSGGHPGMYYVKALADGGLNPWVTPQRYDNVSDFFGTGRTINNNIGVAQATENGNYSMSFGNSNQTGIIASTGMQRYNAKVSAETNLNKVWKAGFTGNYIQSDIDKATGANDGLLATVWGAPASYNLKGNPTHLPGNPYAQINYRALNFGNPYWQMDNNTFNERSNRFFGNGYVNFSPEVNWGRDSKFNVKYQLGADSYAVNYQDIFEFGSGGGTGSMENYGNTVATFNSLLTANYKVRLADDLDLSALIGNEINHQNLKTYDEVGQAFNFGGFKHIDNATIQTASEAKYQYRTVGFFGSLDLAYRNMLFLNVTGRNDIVSSMPRDNRSFFYPSVSLGFVLTELEGLKNNSTLSFLKLRASYAEVGQAAKYIPNHYSIPNYGGGFWLTTPVLYPVDGVTAYNPSPTIYDANLKPQNTKTKEFGLEAKFLDNMISLDYTYSRQDVKDQIFPVPLAGSTGAGQYVTNGGKIHTNAHEISLNVNPIRTKNSDLNIGVNFTKIGNYVDELATGVESIFLGGFTTPQVRAAVGQQFPVIYGGSFQKDAQGRVLVDENPSSKTYGMPMLGKPDIIGKVAPKFLMGANLSFRYQRFTLSTVFDWKNGGQMYSGSNGLINGYGRSKVTEDRTGTFIYPGFKADGTPNNIVRGGASDPQGKQVLYNSVLQNIDEAYIYENSFIKMRELALNYKFPKFSNGLSLNATAFARNILIWTKLPNFDPETSQGNTNMGGAFERFSVPQTSSFGLGLNLTF